MSRQEESARASYGNLLGFNDARSSGYRNQLAQDMRFKSFEGLFLGAPGEFTVLDIGCGVGAMAHHLSALRKPSRYVGLDVLPEVVERARSLNSEMDWCEFLCADATDAGSGVPECDVVILCDTFCKIESTSRETILESIRSIWRLARYGMAVTLSSRYSDVDDGWRATFTPEFIFGWAFHSLSERVMIDHTYAPHVFTLTALKQPSAWRSEVTIPRREGWSG